MDPSSDLAAFVRYLGHSHIAIKSIVTGKPGAQEGHFQAITINKAEDYIALRNSKRQLWINLQKLKPEIGEFISFNDVESYKNVYIDLDCIKPDGFKDYAATEEERATALSQLPILRTWLESHSLRCGLVLHTGNGAGMVLPIPETKAEPVFIAKLSIFLKMVQADIPNTDPAMFDPPRVIGIPGTVNAKLETDDRKNQVREIVGNIPERIVDQALLELINSMEPDPTALKEWTAKFNAPQAPPEANGPIDAEDILDRLTGLFEYEPELKALLDGNIERFKGDRSAVEYGVCGRLVKFGFTDPEIDFVMCKVSKIGKWQEEGDHYRFEQTLRKLREAEEEQHPNETEAQKIKRLHAEANIPITRERADAIEARTGVHIYNAIDDPKTNEISEEELEAYSLPDGPKFECNLPQDHFIQRFMAYGSDISDAYIEYWFAGGLFALAVAADKKIKVSLKQGTIYPNLYVSINGKSSLARKSTVVDKSEAMLCQVLPGMLSALVPTEFSPEAFTEHLSDHNHAPWIRDEAAGVLSIMKRDYMRGFKDSLMQLFDCKPFYRKLRTSQRKGTKTEFRVDDPYLNLLWATTDASLGANTEQNDTLSGFMARFLFFFPQGKKTKWLPLEEGTAANSIFEGVVRDQLVAIAAKMAELPECTAMHFSPDAARYYTEWQRDRENEWTASNDGNAMQIYSRLAPTVVKFGMLFELGSPDFDITRPIRLEFIQEATQLVDRYFMPTAMAVYELVGANAEKNVIDRIIAYLKKHGGKATKKEVLRDVKIKSKEFEEYLSTMLESGIVETKIVKRSGKGRDTLYLFLINQTNVGNVAKVAKIAKIAKVEEIPSENKEGKTSTLATLATIATFPIVDTMEKKESRTSPARKEDPGLTKFKAGMKKRTCSLCGEHFSYDLGIHWQGGYICAKCHREGPPNVAENPPKADA